MLRNFDVLINAWGGFEELRNIRVRSDFGVSVRGREGFWGPKKGRQTAKLRGTHIKGNGGINQGRGTGL